MVIQNWALKSNVGRHRYRACLELGIECPTKVITDASPNDIVASLNIFRRHLTPSQIAMVMTKLKEPFMKEAKFRQQEGGEKKLPLPATEAGEVAEILAKKGGIGASTMKDALLVDAHGTDEKKQEVVQGKKSVKTAAKEIREEAKKKETGFRCNCRCRLCRLPEFLPSHPFYSFWFSRRLCFFHRCYRWNCRCRRCSLDLYRCYWQGCYLLTVTQSWALPSNVGRAFISKPLARIINSES